MLQVMSLSIFIHLYYLIFIFASSLPTRWRDLKVLFFFFFIFAILFLSSLLWYDANLITWLFHLHSVIFFCISSTLGDPESLTTWLLRPQIHARIYLSCYRVSCLLFCYVYRTVSFPFSDASSLSICTKVRLRTPRVNGFLQWFVASSYL